MDVSRETVEKLELYASLIHKWQKAINLVSPSTLDYVWERHINDSLQLIDLIKPDDANLLDFGSGAGFPGMVIAIARPDISVTLVESDQRKCSFLKTVSRETKTPITIINERIEAVEANKIKPDIITARALASLTTLLDFSLPYAGLNPELRMIFLKGQKSAGEIAEAQEKYIFEAGQYPSLTDNDGVVLVVSHLCIKQAA